MGRGVSLADIRPDQRDGLITYLYDATLDPRLWSGLATKVAHALGSSSMALMLRHRDNSGEWLSLTGNFNERAIAIYDAYYHQHNVWVERIRRLKHGCIYLSEDLIADDDMLRSEFYQDWSGKLGCFFVTGTMFETASGDVCTLGVHRALGQERYTGDDKAFIADLVPHLGRALDVRHLLSQASIERQAALDALDRTKVATLVLGRSGIILYANRQAEALLRAGDSIAASDGCITVCDSAASEWLMACVRSAVDVASGRRSTGGGTVPLPRGERLPLSVLVAPLPTARDGFGPQAPAAILFVRDPERPMPSTTLLQELFGLTAAEASIAALLADGRSIDVVASAQGIKVNTARTHLKNVLAKTGTKRQAQLVALILNAVNLER
jgi:DNA-binding CsgD family transcriptional regulator